MNNIYFCLFLRLPYSAIMLFTADHKGTWIGTEAAKDSGARVFLVSRLHLEFIWDEKYIPKTF